MPNDPAAAPPGPYGPYGPPAPPPGPFGPQDPGGRATKKGPGGRPREKGNIRPVAGLVAAGVALVALVLLAGAAFSGGGDGGGDGIEDLAAPKTLGHDPVPAERSITTKPARCGIGRATVRALVPGAHGKRVDGDCAWTRPAGAGPALDVRYTTVDSGSEKASRVAAAIGRFGRATAAYTPVTGLGEDAAYAAGPPATGRGVEAVVVFRTADLVTTVTYKSRQATASAAARFRRGAFRAAAEAAKALGAAANPAAAPVRRTAPVTVPSDVCKLVPEDLFQTLGDDDDPLTHSADSDLIVEKDNIPSATTSGCRSIATSGSRHYSTRIAEVSVTAPTKPGGEAAVNREYLRTYYTARAERATSGGGGRYFQALSGLGDQAFCSYLEGRRSLTLGTNLAEVVVRSRTALITVRFGTEAGDSGLTQDQTVKGAYAIAVKAAAGVK